jgi:outer membrane protein assembly factor BamB
MNASKDNQAQNRFLLLERIGKTAAIFVVLFGTVLLVNFVLTLRQDPLNSQSMQKLLNRLSENENDKELRLEIRSLDLLARKAFFTRQWQIRTGGAMLFFAVLVWLMAIRGKEILRRRLPDPSLTGQPPEPEESKTRQALIYTGAVFVFLSVFAGWRSHQKLAENPPPANPSQQTVMADSSDAEPVMTPPVKADTWPPVALAPPAKKTTDSTSAVPPAKQTAAAPPATPLTRAEQQWPNFRGPLGQGKAFYRNTPIQWNGSSGKNIKWKTAIPMVGFNSPVVWQDRIFLTGGDATKRQVYCFAAKDGSLLWQVDVASKAVKMPKVSKDTGFAASTCATDGTRAFAIFATGDIIALDFNGQILWAKTLPLPDNHYGHSSSLLCRDGLLLVQYDNGNGGKLLALRANTGELAWEKEREVQISWSSPILIEQKGMLQIVLNANPVVAGYDLQSGEQVWSHEGVTGEVAASPGYAAGRVVVANEYSRVAVIDIQGPPKLLWETDEELPEVSSPLATDQYIYIATSGGSVACRDAATGVKYWLQEFDTGFYSSPIKVGDHIYLMDMNGVTHIFANDKTYHLIADCPLGESSNCTPAFLDQHIFIRSDKYLYCIAE